MLALGALLLPAVLRAADPEPPLCFGALEESGRLSRPVVPAQGPAELSRAPIDVSSDEAALGVNGDAVLTGNVQVKQGDREIKADRVQYDAQAGKLTVDGNVEYRDPCSSCMGIPDAMRRPKERSSRARSSRCLRVPHVVPRNRCHSIQKATRGSRT